MNAENLTPSIAFLLLIVVAILAPSAGAHAAAAIVGLYAASSWPGLIRTLRTQR